MMIAVDHPCPTWLARAINRPVIRPSRYCRSDLGRLSWSLPSMRTSSLVVTSHYACWYNDTVPRCHASSSLVWSVQCTGKVRWMLVCCVVAERSRELRGNLLGGATDFRPVGPNCRGFLNLSCYQKGLWLVNSQGPFTFSNSGLRASFLTSICKENPTP